MERAQLESLVAATGCAEQHGGYTFLIDPHWTQAQREIYASIKQSEVGNPKSKKDQGWLCIPTGGSSGGLKFARHDERTLGAAVRGFCEHFNLEQVNVVDVLPPWHVSGLMARVRCAATNGRYLSWQWKMLEAGEWPELSGEEIISLVPTQLQRLLSHKGGEAWLQRLKLIVIGGGPVWTALTEAARAAKLPVVLSYGMTETAAMVAAQTVAEFESGDLSSGRALPHARIEIYDEKTEKILTNGGAGNVRISGDSVMRGYYGDMELYGSFRTADRGSLDADLHLHISGRRDDVVITGGEKVSPIEVESVLRTLGIFTDVAVTSLPHPEWGEELVACYVGELEVDFDQVSQSHLVRHQRPKRYIALSETEWPRNAQGKLNRAELQRLLLAKFPIQPD